MGYGGTQKMERHIAVAPLMVFSHNNLLLTR